MNSSTYEKATLVWGNESLSFSNVENDPHAKHYLSDLDGWYGGVGVKGEESESPSLGNYKTRKYPGTRTLTLKALLIFDKTVDRHAMSRYVSGILGDGQHGTLTVTTGGLTLTGEVLRDGTISHDFVGTNAVRIDIPMKAQDPRLYGESKTYQLFPAGAGTGLVYPLFSDGKLDYGTDGIAPVIVTNEGNEKAFPRFTTANNFPSGVRIDDGRGNAVELRMPIFAQSPVTIDMGGSVMRDGFDFSHQLTRRQWFSVGPGESIQPSVTSLQEGDGWVNIEISDTYF